MYDLCSKFHENVLWGKDIIKCIIFENKVRLIFVVYDILDKKILIRTKDETRLFVSETFCW